jgi:6-phosphogluconolactonase
MRTAVVFTLGAGGVLVTLAASMAAAAGAAGTITVYVGAYTSTSSKGIYQVQLDPATGAVTAPALAVETTNPSFLALHPNGRVLYAVGEVGDFDGKASGFVAAFAIDPESHALTLLNWQPSEGGGPCHLVVDRAGKHVLVANYGGGNVAVLPLDPDGRLRPASSVQVHAGAGANAARQAKPHAHGIYLDAAERFAYAPDLGADKVFVYRYDNTAGTLTPHGAGVLEPGSGPRHLTLDRDGRRMFVINELSNTVTVFEVDPGQGTLTRRESVTTLPPGVTGASYTAEVALSPDGRFLYGSNRGHDSIAVFSVEKGSGRLGLSGHVPAGGQFPRHFALDSTGRWMLVAHQNSDSIAVFRVDPTTGVPSALGAKVSIGKPVCVLFVPQAR